MYVISREDKKIKEKILLDDVLATFALEVIDQKVWIGSSYAETEGKHVVVYDPKTKSQTYVSLVDPNHPVPLRRTEAIFAVGNRIHVVDKHGFVTVLDRQSWEVVDQKQVQDEIHAITYDESRAYTLMQNLDERSEAIITTYYLNDWSVDRQWRVTGNGKTLPQNLIFVRPAGTASVPGKG